MKTKIANNSKKYSSESKISLMKKVLETLFIQEFLLKKNLI